MFRAKRWPVVVLMPAIACFKAVFSQNTKTRAEVFFPRAS